MKVKIEIKQYENEAGFFQNGIFVDEHLFDWGIDEEEVIAAASAIKEKTFGDYTTKAIENNIMEHFLECFSEFVGKNITMAEILQSIERGELEL